jgi:hypothetical protein
VPCKRYNDRSVSYLRLQTLSPATTPTSTSGETSSASQVLLKGLVVRVLLVCSLALNPGSAPMPTNGSIVGTWNCDCKELKKKNICAK